MTTPFLKTAHRRYGLRTNRRRQLGVTLVELLVATVVSLIAVLGMTLVMANTLGATTTTVTTARLSSELRAARQIVERDVRRANFSESFAACIGSGDSTACLSVGNRLAYTEGDAGCIAYSYDRNGADAFGAVRLNTVDSTLEFRTDAADCGASANWNQLTDPDVVAITRFTVNDDEGFEQTLASGLTQLIRKLRIEIVGQACLNAACSETVTREVSHVIRVRNDIIQ